MHLYKVLTIVYIVYSQARAHLCMHDGPSVHNDIVLYSHAFRQELSFLRKVISALKSGLYYLNIVSNVQNTFSHNAVRCVLCILYIDNIGQTCYTGLTNVFICASDGIRLYDYSLVTIDWSIDKIVLMPVVRSLRAISRLKILI